MQNRQPGALSLFNWLLTSRYRHSDSFDQMRARVTTLLSLFTIVASIIMVATTFTLPINPQLRQSIILGSILGGLVPCFVVLALVRAGQLQLATFLIYLILLLSTIPSLSSGVSSNLVLVLALPILYASTIWQWRGTIANIIIESGLLFLTAMLQADGQIANARQLTIPDITIQTLINVSYIVFIGFIAGAASSELRRALRYTTRLITQLRATSEVAQRTSSVINLNDMLTRTVNYIRDRFGYYHVQLFVVDNEQRFANLEASTGEVGELLLQRSYRLSVGSQGAIGQVTLLGEPQIINVESGEERIQRRDELLPETRSELVLPLIAQERIIGALDIQSTQPNAFQAEDIESLGIMASHISIAISNARMFQEQQSALNENRRLFLEAETNLREIKMLNQRLTAQAWDEYLRARSSDSIGYTITNNALRVDSTWTEQLAEAALKRQAVVINEGERRIIAVPVELRGRAIGAIEVETSANVRQSDTLEMLTSVAQRLALSIDNARLFEQAQELAQQELEVNAISARLQGITSMEDILKTAVSELSRALGAQQASIRLGMREKTGANGKG